MISLHDAKQREIRKILSWGALIPSMHHLPKKQLSNIVITISDQCGARRYFTNTTHFNYTWKKWNSHVRILDRA
jgi:hypothetical protein